MTDARDLYRRWIDELWAGRCTAREIVTRDFVGHWPGRDVHGPEELQAVIDETRGMFDEITFTITQGPLVEGDLVTGIWTGQARNADGTSVTFVGNDVLRVTGSAFAEYWVVSSYQA